MTRTGAGLEQFGDGGLSGREHIANVKPPSPEQIQRAQRVVAQMSVTKDEARMLLGMLGIHERV